MKNKPHEDPDCRCPPCCQWMAHRPEGSLSIEFILQLFNVEPDEVHEALRSAPDA